MMHPCQVQALARARRRRFWDRLTRGHARHTCELERPAFAPHAGDHRCRCGLDFAALSTDNGPPLW